MCRAVLSDYERGAAMKKSLIIVILAFFLVVLNGEANAVPLYYSVSGTGNIVQEDRSRTPAEIWGWVIISDEVIMVDSDTLKFEILSSALFMDGYAFAGEDGHLSFLISPDNIVVDHPASWGLGGTGNINTGGLAGDDTNFYHQDGTLYSPYYSELWDHPAPIIEIGNTMGGFGPFPLLEFGGGGVKFTLVSPVPEPATMLLLASGLVGLAGLRRKFKR